MSVRSKSPIFDSTPEDTLLILEVKRAESELHIDHQSVNALDSYGNNAIFYAAWLGMCSTVEKLLDAGGDPMIKNVRGRSALDTPFKKVQALFCRRIAVDVPRGLSFKLCEYIDEGFIGFSSFRGDVNDQLPAVFETRLSESSSGRYWVYEQMAAFIELDSNDDEVDCNLLTPLHQSILQNNAILTTALVNRVDDLNPEDGLGETPLHFAVRKRNAEGLKILLSAGANCNARNMWGETPLHIAAQEDGFGIEHAVFHGAVINAKDFEDQTPLSHAFQRGTPRSMRLLLERGGEVYSKDSDPLEALFIAVSKGNVEEIIRQIDQGTSPSLKNRCGNTPLHLATVLGELAAIEALIEKGADHNAIDEFGKSPLFIAAEDGNAQGLHQLLIRGSNPDLVDALSPLHIACFEGHLDCVQLLLEYGADPSKKDKEGETALHVALSRENMECVRALLKFGVDVDVGDRLGGTPLHKAAALGLFETVCLLIESGANVNACDDFGETALHFILSHDDVSYGALIKPGSLSGTLLHHAPVVGREHCLRALLESGANTNIRSASNYKTALHLAAGVGDRVSLALLVERGADIDALCGSFSTALYYAAEGHHAGCVQELIARGAAINPPKGAQSALAATMKREGSGGYECAKLLIEAGARVDLFDRQGKSLLHNALLRDSDSFILLFLNAGACEDEKDSEGNTPLHSAALQGKLEHINILIQRNALLDCYNDKGVTPLHLAVESGKLECVRALIDAGANVELVSQNGKSPIHIAVEKKLDLLLDQLIAVGCKLYGITKEGDTPVTLAIKTGSLQSVKKLIDAGALLAHNSLQIHHAVETAVIENQSDIAIYLLEKYRETFSQDACNELLVSSVWGDLPNVARVLIAYGAVVEQRDRVGSTLLIHVARRGALESLKLLIKSGACINSKNLNGETPLSASLLEGHAECAEELLSSGATNLVENEEIYAGDQSVELVMRLWPRVDLSPLINLLSRDIVVNFTLRCIEKREPIALWIIERKNAFSAKDLRSLLYSSVIHGAERCFQSLFEKVTKSISGGQKDVLSEALCLACRHGRVQFIPQLLKAGADIESEMDGGERPLFIASHAGYKDCVRLLTQRGAKINANNHEGETPLHIACYHQHAECVRVLLKAGGDLTFENNEGLKPLDWCTSFDEDTPEVWKVVLEEKESRHLPNFTTERAGGLHIAAACGFRRTVKAMLEAGESVHSKTASGLTPIDFAKEAGNLNCLTLLHKYGAKLGDTKLKEEEVRNVIDSREAGSPISLLEDAAAEESLFKQTAKTYEEQNAVYEAAKKGDKAALLQFTKGGETNLNSPIGEKGKTPLLMATLEGDIRAVHLLLDMGADPNITDQDGYAPLHIAAELGEKNVLMRLLNGGANYNTLTCKSMDALRIAASKGDYACVLALLLHGAKVEDKRANKSSALQLAVDAGSIKTVELLLNFGADPNHFVDGFTPLDLAVSQQNEMLIRLLLCSGGDFGDRRKAQTPLIYATENGYCDVVRALLKRGVDVNQTLPLWLWRPLERDRFDGKTALHIAARSGNASIVEEIVRYSYSSKEDLEGFTPLHYAAKSGHNGCVNLLLNTPLVTRGKVPDLGFAPLYIHVDGPSENGETALYLAAENGHYQCVRMLLKEGAKVDAQTKEKVTPLEAAITNSHFDCVRILIEQGADFNHYGKRGSLVHISASKGDVGLMKLLLDAGADPSVRADEGITPLIICVKSHNERGVQLLIEKGASINQRDDAWNTPLHEAVRVGDPKIVKALLNAGADPNQRNRAAELPIHLIGIGKGVTFLKLLLDYGVDVNTTDSLMRTPLHQAAKSYDVEGMRLLIERGANVNAASTEGVTPLHCCIFMARYVYGFLNENERDERPYECVKILCQAGADVKQDAEECGIPTRMAINIRDPELLGILLGIKSEFKGKDRHLEGLNAHDQRGWTLLLYAIEEENLYAIRMLLAAGVRVDQESLGGLSPMNLAKRRGNVEVMTRLLYHMKKRSLNKK